MVLHKCIGTQYSNFIADLCKKREARKYLEIGVRAGINLAKIEVDEAIGIDPEFRLSVDPTLGKKHLSLYSLSSDRFFKDYRVENVDLAFLDGMHLFEYLLRDIYNVEKTCCRGGLIVVHDCLPYTSDMVARRDTLEAWTGDVWKIIPILAKYRSDLRVTLVDCEPTGLVAISNLDPSSTVLSDNYHRIVDEFSVLPNT